MATSMGQRVSSRKLSDALGAEVLGVDLSQPVDDDSFNQILKIWHDNCVIVFRNQSFSEEQQIAFLARFGELWTVPVATRSTDKTDRPDVVMLITNIRDSDGKAIGSLPDGEMFFHHDTIYTERPMKAAALFAIDSPKSGGETRFLNLYKAFEALPQRIREKIEGRRAYHHYRYGTTGGTGPRSRDIEAGGAMHPCVIVHPDTGRKILFMDPLMTQRIEGLADTESDALLKEIFEIVVRPEFIYEHPWRPGDLVIWDNRCVAHGRNDFAAGERRLMRRVATVMDKAPAA